MIFNNGFTKKNIQILITIKFGEDQNLKHTIFRK